MSDTHVLESVYFVCSFILLFILLVSVNSICVDLLDELPQRKSFIYLLYESSCEQITARLSRQSAQCSEDSKLVNNCCRCSWNILAIYRFCSTSSILILNLLRHCHEVLTHNRCINIPNTCACAACLYCSREKWHLLQDLSKYIINRGHVTFWFGWRGRLCVKIWFINPRAIGSQWVNSQASKQSRLLTSEVQARAMNNCLL